MYERNEIQATISVINPFSGTATAVIMTNGSPQSFQITWQSDRPRIDEGDTVMIRPISSKFARITSVVSQRITTESDLFESVGNEGQETANDQEAESVQRQS